MIASGVDYWVKVKGEHYYRYELADGVLPNSLQTWVRANVFNTVSDNLQCLEYQDSGRNNYRAAQIVDNRLESVIFIAVDDALPERDWLSTLFEKPVLEKHERMALLAGIPPSGVAEGGPIICSCFNVGEQTIRAAIREKGLKTHQEVGQCLKAGTNCGSCVPEIKALL